MTEFDFAIAGAGLAGLSLAKSLDSSGKFGRGCLIEPRLTYERDHIWCFWNNAPSNLAVPVRKTWNRWKVAYRGRSRVCTSKKYPYTCVFGEDYYQEALNIIKCSKQLDLFLGQSLTAVAYGDAAVSLTTNRQTIETKLLFDSRPPAVSPTGFRQEFYGLVVEADRDVFDHTCVTLMDFRDVRVRDGFHFFYVLPFSAREALVESAYVGLGGLSQDEHRGHLLAYLHEEFALDHFVERHKETGLIPMQPLSESSTDARHVPIGTRGGLVRSSTGYAFSAIHRFSEQVAGNCQPGEPLEPPAVLSAKAKLLDTVLLSYLRQKPWEGPLLLSSLFFKVEPSVLVRFITDTASVADDAAILAAIPRKMELSAMMAKVSLPA